MNRIANKTARLEASRQREEEARRLGEEARKQRELDEILLDLEEQDDEEEPIEVISVFDESEEDINLDDSEQINVDEEPEETYEEDAEDDEEEAQLH